MFLTIIVILYFLTLCLIIYNVYKMRIMGVPIFAMVNNIWAFIILFLVFKMYTSSVIIAILASIPILYIHAKVRVFMVLYIVSKFKNYKI